jgi:hypothetical protein
MSFPIYPKNPEDDLSGAQVKFIEMAKTKATTKQLNNFDIMFTNFAWRVAGFGGLACVKVPPDQLLLCKTKTLLITLQLPDISTVIIKLVSKNGSDSTSAFRDVQGKVGFYPFIAHDGRVSDTATMTLTVITGREVRTLTFLLHAGVWPAGYANSDLINLNSFPVETLSDEAYQKFANDPTMRYFPTTDHANLLPHMKIYPDIAKIPDTERRKKASRSIKEASETEIPPFHLLFVTSPENKNPDHINDAECVRMPLWGYAFHKSLFLVIAIELPTPASITFSMLDENSHILKQETFRNETGRLYYLPFIKNKSVGEFNFHQSLQINLVTNNQLYSFTAKCQTHRQTKNGIANNLIDLLQFPCAPSLATLPAEHVAPSSNLADLPADHTASSTDLVTLPASDFAYQEGPSIDCHTVETSFNDSDLPRILDSTPKATSDACFVTNFAVNFATSFASHKVSFADCFATTLACSFAEFPSSATNNADIAFASTFATTFADTFVVPSATVRKNDRSNKRKERIPA